MAADKGGNRLYVVNQGSHDVNAYFIYRNNGYLVPVPGSPFPVAGTGTNIAVHPSGKFVYVTTDSSHGGESSVTALAVNADGSLTPIAGSPFGIADNAASIVIDPRGRYLYVGHSNSSDINAYSINAVNGTLTPVPGEPFTVPVSDACFLCDAGSIFDLAIDPSGTYLLAPVTSNGEVGVFRIDASNGALAGVPNSPFIDSLPNSPTAPGSQTESIAIDSQNNFVFLDDNECNGDGTCAHAGIAVFRLDAATGNLSPLPGHFNNAGICNQDSIRTDPSGNFLYTVSVTPCAGSSAPGVIQGFSISLSNGSLAVVPGSPFAQKISAPPNVFPEWSSIVVTP
jgi:6-phosphogluconolactonase